jgi:hypothetical protein
MAPPCVPPLTQFPPPHPEAASPSLARRCSTWRPCQPPVGGRGTGRGPRLNGNTFLTAGGAGATALGDGAPDVLTGGSGLDWFFANLSHGSNADSVLGALPGEVIEDVG